MAATVSDRRQALAELARSRRAAGTAGRNLRIVAVAVVAISLVGLLGRWLSGRWSTPPEVLAIRASVDGQITEMMQAARSGTDPAAVSGSFGSIFETFRLVPEAYRDQARAEIGRLFEAREAAEVESYFALPPDQRAVELDRRLKAEDRRRNSWEAQRNQRSGQAGGRPGGPLDTRGGRPATAGGRRRDGTEENRNARSKRYLDNSSAESRARRLEYRRAKDQRRIQLGLVPRSAKK